MPKLQIADAEIHYEVDGVGPPLLLLAGIASDGQSWAPIKPLLGQHFTLISMDNRACGQTKDDGAAITIERIADDAVALLDHLSIERADIVAHSMGTAIAMALAARHPERAGKLVLAAGAAETPSRAASVIETLLALREAGIDENAWYRSFFHWLFKPDFFENKNAVDAAVTMSRAYPYAQSVEDMRRQYEAVRAFAAADLPPIHAGTLLLAGEFDILVPPAAVETTREFIASAEIQILPGAGHSLHWDAPQAFADAVITFLEKT